ncbi:MAG: hypothetical protein ACOCW3_05200 [Spirochaetota bacterium]
MMPTSRATSAAVISVVQRSSFARVTRISFTQWFTYRRRRSAKILPRYPGGAQHDRVFRGTLTDEEHVDLVLLGGDDYALPA